MHARHSRIATRRPVFGAGSVRRDSGAAQLLRVDKAGQPFRPLEQVVAGVGRLDLVPDDVSQTPRCASGFWR